MNGFRADYYTGAARWAHLQYLGVAREGIVLANPVKTSVPVFPIKSEQRSALDIDSLKTTGNLLQVEC